MSRPKHLQAKYARQFSDPSVVENYVHRPTYPAEVLERLMELAGRDGPLVLEVGCGPGEIARGLAKRGAEVHAVDPSAPMLVLGKTLAETNAIEWFNETASSFAYPRTYDLVVAAESLHWTEWDQVLPKIGQSLAEDGALAIVERNLNDVPWWPEVRRLVERYSTNQDYRPFDLVESLEEESLFRPQGRDRTTAVGRSQSVEDYVAYLHSRNGLSTDRMSEESRHAFDKGLRSILAGHATEGDLHFDLTAEIVWGQPL